jgi:5-formyltetrahydrofolate cyclo-ligase
MVINLRQSIRSEIRLKRRLLGKEDQHNAAKLLLTQLAQHKKIQTAKHIALYLANDGELDPMFFIQWCWSKGKEVYLPVIHPFNKSNLLFLRYAENTKLQTNKFGILEPLLNVNDVCPVSSLDVLCTPLVAFDHSGARLGMGGGFYDRTLAKWFSQQDNKTYSNLDKINHSNFHPIGIAHDCQLVDSIPIEQWDIPLPEIITPSKCYQF